MIKFTCPLTILVRVSVCMRACTSEWLGSSLSSDSCSPSKSGWVGWVFRTEINKDLPYYVLTFESRAWMRGNKCAIQTLAAVVLCVGDLGNSRKQYAKMNEGWTCELPRLLGLALSSLRTLWCLLSLGPRKKFFHKWKCDSAFHFYLSLSLQWSYCFCSVLTLAGALLSNFDLAIPGYDMCLYTKWGHEDLAILVTAVLGYVYIWLG